MAERQRREFHSKPLNSRHSPQGMSLANLSEPLNFGPALVSSVQPIGVPEGASTAVQQTPSSSSTISSTSGLFPLDHDAEAVSFVGQQPSPPAISCVTGCGISQLPKSTSLAVSSFASCSPQQETQDGTKYFTMASSGQDVDHFLTPLSETPSTVSSLSSYSFQSPFSQYSGNTSLPTSQPSGIPQGTLLEPSNLPSRRVHPKVNQQIGYSQSDPPQSTHSLPSQMPNYPPPTQSLAQGSPPISSPALLPQLVSTASNPQPLPQMYLPPQDIQQFGAPQFPQQTSQVPILPVEQQFSSSSPEGVVPTALVAPVQPHWFYLKENGAWMPFSYLDSDCLEHAYRLPNTGGNCNVPTNGGRYDVDLDKRTREAVYWEEPATIVRRCTWFYKGEGGSKLIPYEENLAERFENEFQAAVGQNLWPKRIDLHNGDYVMFHNTNVLVHFQSGDVSEWTGEDIKVRPRVIRRGIFDMEDYIDDGEPAQIDHLVFVIHGIGPIADLRFRNIVECVDDLRMVTLSMLNEHHEELAKGRLIGRIEYLPVQWHSKLHNDSTGVDQKLHSISLPSITKLRDFTNSTLLDILFYTSPTYCQTIVDTVGSEMKRLLDLFRKRNPLFKGDISVCGHSLGSSIMFDILYHQKDQLKPGVKTNPSSKSRPSATYTSVPEESEDLEEEDDIDTIPRLSEVLNQLGLKEYETTFKEEKIDLETLLSFTDSDMKEIGVRMGPRKKLLGYIKQYTSLQERQKQEKSDRTKARTKARAIKALKESQDNKDDLSSSSAQTVSAVESVEVLYHQGMAGTGQPYVNYPQLHFKPFAMFALGSPIGMFLTVRGVDQVGPDYQLPTCPRFYNIFHPLDPVAYKMEPVVDPTFAIPPVMLPHHKGRKRMHLELRDNLSRFGANLKASLLESVRVTWESIHEFARAHTGASSYVTTESEMKPPTIPSSTTSDSFEDERVHHELKSQIGQMNGGNRIDYVLQEKPIESLNEYLFALSSHVCYWLSEDTALFMLREIYNAYPSEIHGENIAVDQ